VSKYNSSFRYREKEKSSNLNQFLAGIKDCFIKFLNHQLWKRNNKTTTKGSSFTGGLKYPPFWISEFDIISNFTE